jgi:hypothetical protein
MTTNHTKAGTGQPLLYQHGQVIQEFGTLLKTAALYEYMDLVNGGQGERLTIEELCEVVRAFNVPTTLV